MRTLLRIGRFAIVWGKPWQTVIVNQTFGAPSNVAPPNQWGTFTGGTV